MKAILYTHKDCFSHDTGSMHPERAQRLAAILHALKEIELPGAEWREAPLASIEQIARVHPEDYIEAVQEAIPTNGHAYLDGDTPVSPGSWNAALRAAGAACAAVTAVATGEATRAFCAVRPPGHHAEPQHAMGFCLFNNVAIAAEEARSVHGMQRVAVVDFDVHHGNGTQAAFWDDGGLFFASTHQSPLYPGTGQPNERGRAGNILNATLPPGAGSAAFRKVFAEQVLPALSDYGPELILVSAGFDAHRADPLANLNLEAADYHWATRELCALADGCAEGRVVSTLEGGYDLEALAESATQHVLALLEP